MKIIDTDILTVKRGIIVHQVNTFGIWGAGLALKLKEQYPQAYSHHKDRVLKLGDFTLEFTGKDDLEIASLCAQKTMGRQGKHTLYWAFAKAIQKLSYWIAEIEALGYERPIYIPYKIGCGLGGGDWHVILALIEESLPQAIICKLGR